MVVFAGVGIAIVTGTYGAGVGAVDDSFLGVCSVVQPFVEVLEVFLLLGGMVGMESQQEDVLLPSSWVIPYSFPLHWLLLEHVALVLERFCD